MGKKALAGRVIRISSSFSGVASDSSEVESELSSVAMPDPPELGFPQLVRPVDVFSGLPYRVVESMAGVAVVAVVASLAASFHGEDVFLRVSDGGEAPEAAVLVVCVAYILTVILALGVGLTLARSGAVTAQDQAQLRLNEAAPVPRGDTVVIQTFMSAHNGLSAVELLAVVYPDTPLSLRINHLCCSGCFADVREALKKVAWLADETMKVRERLLSQEQAEGAVRSLDYSGWVDVTVPDLTRVDFVEIDRVLREEGMVASEMQLRFPKTAHIRFVATWLPWRLHRPTRSKTMCSSCVQRMARWLQISVRNKGGNTHNKKY